MATLIMSKINIDERVKGFKTAFDLMCSEEMTENDIKAIYKLYEPLLILFLADMQKRKDKIFEEFSHLKKLDERNFELLKQLIKDL